MTTVEADPRALRTASDTAAHDGWTIRLAADALARVLANAQPHLGAAAAACTDGVEPVIAAAHHVADSLARLSEALGTLADTYRHVDGQLRPAARWC